MRRSVACAVRHIGHSMCWLSCMSTQAARHKLSHTQPSSASLPCTVTSSDSVMGVPGVFRPAGDPRSSGLRVPVLCGPGHSCRRHPGPAGLQVLPNLRDSCPPGSISARSAWGQDLAVLSAQLWPAPCALSFADQYTTLLCRDTAAEARSAVELPEAVIDVMVSLRTWLQARPACPQALSLWAAPTLRACQSLGSDGHPALCYLPSMSCKALPGTGGRHASACICWGCRDKLHTALLPDCTALCATRHGTACTYRLVHVTLAWCQGSASCSC